MRYPSEAKGVRCEVPERSEGKEKCIRFIGRKSGHVWTLLVFGFLLLGLLIICLVFEYYDYELLFIMYELNLSSLLAPLHNPLHLYSNKPSLSHSEGRLVLG